MDVWSNFFGMKKVFTSIFIWLTCGVTLAQLSPTNGPTMNASSYCVYADEEVVFAAQGPVLFKSTDNGDSFEQVTIDAEYPNIDPRLVLRIDDVFICATNTGDRIYRSTDLGETWTSSWTGTPDISGFPAAVVTGGIVKDNTFIIWGTNLYRYSTDLGQTWQSYASLTPGSGEGMANTDGRLWIGAYNYTGYSDDNGETWTQTATNPHVGFGLSARDFVQIGDRTYCGTSSAGNQAMKYTTDNGTTWVSVNAPLSVISDMEYIDGVFYAYCYNGLFRSLDDGISWELYLNVTQSGYGGTFDIVGDKLWIATNTGPKCYDMTTGVLTSPAIIGGLTNWVLSGPDYMYAAAGNNLSVSTNNGASWSTVTLPANATTWGNITYASMDGNTLYLVHSLIDNAPGVIATSDGGATWQTTDLSAFNGNSPTIFLSYNPQIMITSQWFVVHYFYSNDGGASWQEASISAAPGSTLPSSYGANVLYRVGSRLILSTNSGHSISTDNGQTWTFVQPVFSLTQFSGWDNRIVAIENHWSGKRIHESIDGGLTWTQVNGAFPVHADSRINPVAMTTIGNSVVCQNWPLDNTVENPNVIYTLSETGDWTPTPELGILPYEITSFDGNGLNDFVVSTNGGGVWRNSTSLGVTEMTHQSDLLLYPVPASDQLYVQQTTHQTSTLRIFSISGALMWQGKTSGTITSIDIAALPAGIYTLCLTTDRGDATSKTFVKYQY